MLFGGYLNVEENIYKVVFLTLLFGFLGIGALLLSLENILMKELRLYGEHLEKEWYLFGKKTLDYSNIRLNGITTQFVAALNFLYLKRPAWYQYKCCGIDEHLLNPQDREKLIETLSLISYRSKNEFLASKIEMNPLVLRKDI